MGEAGETLMPAYRGRRIRPLQVKREIKSLMDVFPKVRAHIERLSSVFTPFGERVPNESVTIYRGEALVRSASGDTEGYGLGTVENQSLVILINGVHPFRQGDIVTINDSREYEVELPPKHLNAFMELRLGQRSQVTRPT